MRKDSKYWHGEQRPLANAYKDKRTNEISEPVSEKKITIDVEE